MTAEEKHVIKWGAKQPMIAPLRFPDLAARAYVCRRCGTAVARMAGEISVLGRPAVTTYENPAGIACEIVTLAGAMHLEEAPEGMTEHSWFEGYAWRQAACAGCGTFLGWRYDAVLPGAEPAVFHGLLVAMLRRARPGPPAESTS